jgi:hypothetical protein
MELKAFAKRILPARLSAEISAYRWWRHLIQQNARNGNVELTRRLLDRCGNSVLAGPFKGLKYPADILLSHCSTHNLLGTYEAELHPWLERVFGNRYDRAMVVGCGEGYYAVGIALRAGIRVDAYDTCFTVRRDCRRTAEANRVSDLVHVHSWCGAAEIRKLHGARYLVFSDCEGYEQILFTSQTICSLTRCDLLIELHDHGMPHASMRELLKARLLDTHRIEIVASRIRRVIDFPHLSHLDPVDAQRAIDEGARGMTQEWMLATSRCFQQ